MSFKKGDYVRIVKYSNIGAWNDVREGDVGIITLLQYDLIRVKFFGRTYKNTQSDNYFPYRLKKITEDEAMVYRI